MKLTLFSKTEYKSITLPERITGQYWLRARSSIGKLIDIIAVEAMFSTDLENASYWCLRSNREYKVLDEHNNEVQKIQLNPNELYKIHNARKNEKFVLYTEPVRDDYVRFFGYEILNSNATLTVGRDSDNEIYYSNKYASRKHAELNITHNGLAVRDLRSTNHTYVNGKMIEQKQLNIGDAVYIMGMQIVVSDHFIFINNPDKSVKVNSGALRVLNESAYHNAVIDADDDEYTNGSGEFYYRAPRFKHDVDIFDLKIDPPPSSQSNDEVPMAMLVGPSLTMGMASVASGVFAVSSAVERGDIASAFPSFVMSVSMILGTLMWPLVTKTFQRKLHENKENKRQITYKAYLKDVQQSITREIKHQERVLQDNDVSISIYGDRILSSAPQFWERTPKHTDFLSLRIGYGNLPLKANIQFPERKFAVQQDNLTEEMYKLSEQIHLLHNVPICLPLTERYICGIYAEKALLYAYVKNLILQLVALHCYDEVKLVMLCDESDSDEFMFIRYLPHVMNNERTVRYIATNSEEVKELSSVLDGIIEHRKNLNDSKLTDELPYFVIICLDKELSAKAEFVRRILDHKVYIKFSVLSLFEQLKDLPKECTAVAELHKDLTGSLTLIDDVSEPPVLFASDLAQIANLPQIMRVLSNTYVNISRSNFSLPKKFTFYEMLNIGITEHLNLIDNWNSNDPTKSLAAVIGIDQYGEPFKLDLHEQVHGPHGLVAGMTGSGKSEFIITYILSMAVNYHPYDVAFILIDYKGGSMAKSFDNIPHNAGIITNLDGNEIKRSLASMRSELHRRERIFREVTLQHNISNIDIYKYQKLYRDGKVTEPLPHLIIISDEFAELKKEQPDFMTELTSTARVGRSLGVHLILATQKPGGVVDDQIRSNSRFRICLKVQDSGDSTEMLGRTEAAELTDTGRFYMQVGNNEIFEIGQSAWAGAPYYPSVKVIRDRDDSVSVINTNGRIIAEANTNRFAYIKDPPKQLDEITRYINKISNDEQIKHWKMWLDPIPSFILIRDLEEKYSETKIEQFILNPIVGEFDDPSHQSQGILRVPITRDGNVLIYGSAGSGKAMFVEAICFSLIKTHAPREINIYIMDFGAETMTAFAEAPQFGDVILSHEIEKVNNLFKLLLGKLENRKKKLAQFGGDIIQYNKQSREPEPSILVIINNYAVFTELFEDKSGEVNYLSREGVKYGIYFILTCTGVNNVRYSMLQNFKTLFCLQLNNPDDYSSVVGKTQGMQPDAYKGRGLFRYDKDSLFEFQVAGVTEEDPPYQFIREFCNKIRQKYPNTGAAMVPVLPEKITTDHLSGYVLPGAFNRVPIGITKDSLEVTCYDFALSSISLILSINQEWQNFIDALGSFLASEYDVRTIVFTQSNKAQIQEKDSKYQAVSDIANCVNMAREIYNIVLVRNNEYKGNLEAGKELPLYEPLFVIIQSISHLKSMLERYKPGIDEKKEADDDTPFNRLQVAMEKCENAYNIHFIVAESLNLIAQFTAENWYKTHINGNNGIWVGNGISNQYRFTLSKRPNESSLDIGSDFGFIINNASATLVKLLRQ